MLSARLVRTIEDHAEDLTRGVLDDVGRNPNTPAYHGLTRGELHRRVYDVYRNLGKWLTDTSEASMEQAYGQLGRLRRTEGIPLSQVVFALLLTKEHLWNYIHRVGLVESMVELYQEEEFIRLVGHFFDRAVYYTVKGYEA